MIPTSSDAILAKADEFTSAAENAATDAERRRYLCMARYWLVLASEVVGANIVPDAEATLVPASADTKLQVSAD
ncbi:MAG TPA: hypothetical protein VFB45_25715 [Pseudolabrys sp.]|nr:hypothetical protein [Pseudolabrys sp.]